MDQAIASVLTGSSRRAVDMTPAGSFQFIHFITRTKAGLAVATMLFVLLISLSFEPPFLTTKSDDIIEADELSYPRTLVVTAAAGSLFYILPKVAK
jgi:hypothetical protein